jgi:Ca2+/Na+ antiporter
MAISNAFGSNIFDMLLGLGVPWFLQLCLVRGVA